MELKCTKRDNSYYTWPHLYAMSIIYCLLSKTQKERINSFYRKCLRIIYHLFQCSTADLHEVFRLPTPEEKYRKCLAKQLNNIEQELIGCYLIHKNVVNTARRHYLQKRCIPSMPSGRPSTRMTNFYNKSTTFLDKLLRIRTVSYDLGSTGKFAILD